MDRKIVFVHIFIAIITIILFVPQITYEEPYEAIGYFERIEDYTEVEPFERECKWEEVSSNLTEGWKESGRPDGYQSGIKDPIYTLIIKNTDNYDATFSVIFTKWILDYEGSVERKTVNEYIGVGQTQTFSVQFQAGSGNYVHSEYAVSPPTVIDERVVTKQRTVIDERIVTKYRTVNKSIIDMLGMLLYS